MSAISICIRWSSMGFLPPRFRRAQERRCLSTPRAIPVATAPTGPREAAMMASIPMDMPSPS